MQECSLKAQGSFQGAEQGRVAERLDQAVDGSNADIRPRGEIRVGSDENGRDVITPPQKLTPQLRARHSRHRNIENQTFRPVGSGRLEKIARSRVHLGCEAKLLKKVRQRLSYGLIVIYNAYENSGCGHTSAVIRIPV